MKKQVSIGSPLLFDRQILRKRRRRMQGKYVYATRLSCYLHDQIKERLQVIKHSFSSILVLGDLDIAPLFPEASLLQFSLTGIPSLLEFDDEFLPFSPHSFDFIVSFMEMHFFNDIPGFLKQVYRCLKPDGMFLGVFLGQDTLWQLRQALHQVEEKIYGGASPRVIPMVKASDAAALMKRAGFSLPVVDIDRLTITYQDTYHLLKELKESGLTNILFERLGRFGEKRLFQTLSTFYEKTYQKNSKILSCFMPIYMMGWSPSPDHPKPLIPGSATALLSDFL